MRTISVVALAATVGCGTRSNPPPPPPPSPPAPTWSVRCDPIEPHPAADAHPSFDIERGAASGDLPDDQIRVVLELSAPELSACDAAQRRTTPQLAAVVEVRFFIAPSGSVVDVAASTSAGASPARDLAACTRGVIAKLHFPSPRGGGGVAATYPIAFHPARAGTYAADRRAAADDIEHLLAANLPAIADCLTHSTERFAVSLVPLEPARIELDGSHGTSCVSRVLAPATLAAHPSTAVDITCELAPS